MNTKTKHTAGPWRIGSRCEDNNTLEIVSGAKESPLAYVSPRPHYDDCQVSNAQLIAAAPELLEALQQAANQLRVGYSLKFSDDDVRRMCPAYSQAVDAIAKAKGEM